MTDKITLDPLAFSAALSAFADAERRSETASDMERTEIDPLHEALHAYFITAQVRGVTHELPVIPGGVPGYEALARVLGLAYNQSAKGKGKERHANARPFLDQPIMAIGRMLGSTADGEFYQVIKKAQEASNMVARGNTSGAKAELLGVIVYAAATYLLIEESESQ